MKFILLLTFVTLCYSYPHIGGRNVNINEDGTIVITGANGKRVCISKAIGTSGHKNIDIEVSGPNMPTKRIQINDHEMANWGDTEENQRDKRSSRDSKKRGFQGDIIAEIMKEYQGPVDEKTFEKLLKKVNTAVQAGELNESFYDVLRNLEQVQNKDTMEDLIQRQAFERELKQLQREQQEPEWQRGFTHDSIPVTINSWQQRLHPYGHTFTTPSWGMQRSMGTTGWDRVGFEIPEQMYHQTTGGLRFGTGNTLSPWGMRDMMQQRRMLPCNSITCHQTEQMFSGMKRTVPEELTEILEGEREIMQQQRQLQLQQFVQQHQQKELQEQQEEQQEQQQIQQRQLLQQQYQQQQMQHQQQALQQQQMRQQMQEQQRDWTQHKVQRWPNQWQEVEQFYPRQWQRDQQQVSPLTQFMWNMRPVQRGMMQEHGDMTREFGNQRIPYTQNLMKNMETTQDFTRHMVPMFVN